jgi:hypothetical protein
MDGLGAKAKYDGLGLHLNRRFISIAFTNTAPHPIYTEMLTETRQLK